MNVEALAQLVADGVVAGGSYALMGAGFSLIYNVQKVINVAHGASYTIGAFAAYALAELHGVSLWIAVPMALLCSSVFSVGTEEVFLRRIRRQPRGAFAALVGTFALYVFVENGVQIAFGSNICSFTRPVQEGLRLGPVRMTPIEMVTVIAAALTFLLLGLVFKLSATGKLWRALSEDAERLEILGGDPLPLDRRVSILAGFLAGLAGILVALRSAFRCDMGLEVVIRGLCASVVGGLGSVVGAGIGGLTLGVLESVSVLGSARYKGSVALLLLILFLLLRPQGILGVKERADTAGNG